eukprot:GFKZ01007563.1.p4 GENE.GFKZ01007563.1~~GFKZ01007563.1.p4  ORF type:complete len:123 (-),score=2.69 GFKZ01007563.1:961-1329(-)
MNAGSLTLQSADVSAALSPSEVRGVLTYLTRESQAIVSDNSSHPHGAPLHSRQALRQALLAARCAFRTARSATDNGSPRSRSQKHHRGSSARGIDRPRCLVPKLYSPPTPLPLQQAHSHLPE